MTIQTIPPPPSAANPDQFDRWAQKLYQRVNKPTGVGNVVAATHSVTAGDNYVLCNYAGTVTLTLPDPAKNQNRAPIHIQTYTANTVVSASSNVIPNAGGAAGTAILGATAGKWADIVSNGTSWVIVGAN